MNGFLESLKGDLLDRRMRPVVALVALALLGAIAYAGFGGSTGSTPHVVASAQPAPVDGLQAGVSVTQNTREDALAETTSGGGQSNGPTHDPFGRLATATTTSSAAAATSSSSTSSSAGASTGSAVSTPASSGSSPSASTPTTHPKTVFQLDAVFGEVLAGQERSSNLATLDSLKLLTPLPSERSPLLVYRGVSTGDHSATFTVAGEAILSGPGTCKPSVYHCETIALKQGQVEHIAYLPAGAETTVTYELKIVSIHASEASAAAVASLWRRSSAAGAEVLRSADLLELPGLRESAVAGVLVPTR